MKKLINDPDAVVREALEGIEAAHGDRLRVMYDPYVIVRADAPVQGKVGLISGGGSGHEPMHGGLVGPGMLDAACPGEVFTSPTPDQMLEATKAVDGGAGVLHIVKNYTGDVLNFEMAADLAKGEGIEVEAVVTNDDVAVQDSPLHRRTARRGHHGHRREDLRRGRGGGQVRSPRSRSCAGRSTARARSMGMALTPCVTPAVGRAELRARRGRDGDRHRDPRRAGALPRADGAGRQDRRAPGHGDRRGPALRVGRQGAGLRQRDGRHAPDRAVHRLPRARTTSCRSGASPSSAG